MSHPDPGSTTSRTCSTTVAQYCPLWAPTTPSRFCFWELTRELPGGSPIPGIALVRYSLNFGVPTEPEASELPKGLVLGRDGNIHIRITPLGDVGSHNPPPLGARRPRRHTSGQGLALIPNCHIPTRGSTTSRACSTTVAQYCPLWAPTTPSRFCFWELTRELPGGSPILGLLSCATRLTSEFLRNPKPVSSQKALC